VGLAEKLADVEELGLRAGVFSLGEGLPAMDNVGEGEGHGS